MKRSCMGGLEPVMRPKGSWSRLAPAPLGSCFNQRLGVKNPKWTLVHSWPINRGQEEPREQPLPGDLPALLSLYTVGMEFPQRSQSSRSFDFFHLLARDVRNEVSYQKIWQLSLYDFLLLKIYYINKYSLKTEYTKKKKKITRASSVRSSTWHSGQCKCWLLVLPHSWGMKARRGQPWSKP